jgi:hypothetical protein
MRTTLTLDADVARLVKDEVHRRRRPLKQVVNDALRRALAPGAGRGPRRRYRVRPHVSTLVPGIDPGKLNALADELEDRAIVARLRGRRRS